MNAFSSLSRPQVTCPNDDDVTVGPFTNRYGYKDTSIRIVFDVKPSSTPFHFTLFGLKRISHDKSLVV